MPTNEEIVGAFARLEHVEMAAQNTELRIRALEQSIAALTAKVDTLNSFYGGALSEMTGRFMALLEKVTSGTQPTV